MLVGIDFPAVNVLVGTAYEAGFYLFRTTVEKSCVSVEVKYV